MEEFEISGKKIQIVQGDITKQPDLEAIVNAANAMLAPGGGVAGAIHKAAGPELYEECKKYAPIRVGEAVITKAYKLPNKYVIHTLGPRYGIDKPEDELLASCYKNSLLLADKHGVRSIGFPAISTGIFGYPFEEALQVSFKVILETMPALNSVKVIRLVYFGSSDYSNALEMIKKSLLK